jgi:hypothetical protein
MVRAWVAILCVATIIGGCAHRIWSNRWSMAEIGVQGTAYGVPANLTVDYGQHPAGVAALFRCQIGRNQIGR